MTYEAVPVDNYHFPDETSVARRGHTFETAQAAIAYAMQRIDADLRDMHSPGMSATALWDQFANFGEDVFIFGKPDAGFSGMNFARQRCHEICDDAVGTP